MKKKFILLDAKAQECFRGYGGEEWMTLQEMSKWNIVGWTFDSIQGAESALESMYEYKSFEMSKRIVIILPIYQFQDPNEVQ